MIRTALTFLQESRLEENDGIVLIAPTRRNRSRGWWYQSDFFIKRARFAIKTQSLSSILTLVAFERNTQTSQRFQQRQQQASSLSEGIFDMRRVATKIGAHQESVFFHVTQAPHKSAAANRRETREQLHRAFRPRY